MFRRPRTSFETEFEASHRQFKWIFNTAVFFICLVFVGILTFYVGVIGLGIHTASKTDFSGGLKPVIEEVWCGKPGCFSENK